MGLNCFPMLSNWQLFSCFYIFFFFFFFLCSVLCNLGRHSKEISNMCPLLKCASNYLRTAAPQFLDVMQRRGIKRARYLFFQFRKPSWVFFQVVLFCFVLFPFSLYSFSCSSNPSGCSSDRLQCSPESGPVKSGVREILVFGTVISVYLVHYCSAQKPS